MQVDKNHEIVKNCPLFITGKNVDNKKSFLKIEEWKKSFAKIGEQKWNLSSG